MFGIGGSELLVIVFVALLVFGPGRIPEIARTIKLGLQEWTKVKTQVDSTISEIKQEIDLKADLLDETPPPVVPAAGSSPAQKPAARVGSEEITSATRSHSLVVPEPDDYLAGDTDDLYPDPAPAAREDGPDRDDE